MAEVPFPEGAKDGTVFFHEDKVCIYSEALNTWECRKVVDPSDPNRPSQAVYSTDVYAPEGLREWWQNYADTNGITYSVPPVRTAYDIHRALVGFVCALKGYTG